MMQTCLHKGTAPSLKRTSSFSLGLASNLGVSPSVSLSVCLSISVSVLCVHCVCVWCWLVFSVGVCCVVCGRKEVYVKCVLTVVCV